MQKSSHPRDDGAKPEAASELEHDGTRPSSLIPVHKLPMPDRHYDLQLMRDLTIANGLAGAHRRRHATEAVRSAPADQASINLIGEDMKVRNFAIAAMAAVASIDASARGLDTPAVNATHDGLGLSAHTEEGKLGPEYKSIDDFVPFRARLLHDGWSPASESKCMEELTGVDTEETCRRTPDSLSCHICSKVPEMFLSTGNGHHFMRYRKASRQLDVAVYGDFQDLDFPGQFGLVITGWTVLDAVSGEKLESVVTMRTDPW